ncbi:MAG TPA: hypothetical protein VGB85_26500, partial [Nannocystis sp.]
MLLAALLLLQTPPSPAPPATEPPPTAVEAAPPAEAPAAQAPPGETQPATTTPDDPATDGDAEEPPSATNPAAVGPKEAPAPAHHAPAVGGGATVFDAKEPETDLARSRYTLGKGYTLSSKDERYSLQIRARLQVRYDLEHYNVADKAMAQ